MDIIPNNCIKIKEIISNDDDKYMILSEIFLQQDIMIKVMKYIENYDAEKIYKKLQNHEYFNIMPIFGYITCVDDFKNLKLTLMEKGICNGTDNKQISLLLMKNIKEYNSKFTEKQFSSIFFQIIFTCIKLYSETGIIHNDIKLGNFFITKTDQENEMYSIKSPTINVIVKLHGVRVYLIDFDNGKIPDDSHLFIDDVKNTCKKLFNLYSLLNKKQYDILNSTLSQDSDDVKSMNMKPFGTIKKVYKAIMKYVYPYIRDDVLVKIDI